MAEILIVGTGAMALLFGGHLAASGVKVTLLGTWEEGIRAVREKGIRITGETGEFAYPVKATSDIKEVKRVLLCVCYALRISCACASLAA